MRILLVSPASGWGVPDVWTGLKAGLLAGKHEVIDYDMDGRLKSAFSWLRHQWKRAGRPAEEPNVADAYYLASFELPYKALREKVDAVLIVCGMHLHPDAIIICRKAGLPVGIVFTESPYNDEAQGKLARWPSICWTNERTSVDVLRASNPNTHYLPLAYDPRVHHLPLAHDPLRRRPLSDNESEQQQAPDAPMHDVVFVGTALEERVRLLGAVDWTGIDLGLYGQWTLLGSRHPLRKHIRGGIIDNAEAASLYRGARIGINLYRTSKGYGRRMAHIARGESLNPRALELAACGLFHISEYRPEVAEVFGDAVPTFRTGAEMEELIRHYLANPAERARLAARLPGLVRGRTFEAMAKRIVAEMERTQ